MQQNCFLLGKSCQANIPSPVNVFPHWLTLVRCCGKIKIWVTACKIYRARNKSPVSSLAVQRIQLSSYQLFCIFFSSPFWNKQTGSSINNLKSDLPIKVIPPVINIWISFTYTYKILSRQRSLKTQCNYFHLSATRLLCYYAATS